MAIATNGGHVSRAIDFYKKRNSMYLVIGGTSPWTRVDSTTGETIIDDSTPATPKDTDYKLLDIVALKKIDNAHIVVPDEQGTITYNRRHWRVVTPEFNTILASVVPTGSYELNLNSVDSSLATGNKLRINNVYEGKITNISGNIVTIDTAAPTNIPAGSKVIGGALVETVTEDIIVDGQVTDSIVTGAKYVYLEATLEYDVFPVVTPTNDPLSYRQIGLCTGVEPEAGYSNILRSAAYSETSKDEYKYIGTLETLDNRLPSARDASQMEKISLIIEF